MLTHKVVPFTSMPPHMPLELTTFVISVAEAPRFISGIEATKTLSILSYSITTHTLFALRLSRRAVSFASEESGFCKVASIVRYINRC